MLTLREYKDANTPLTTLEMDCNLRALGMLSCSIPSDTVNTITQAFLTSTVVVKEEIPVDGLVIQSAQEDLPLIYLKNLGVEELAIEVVGDLPLIEIEIVIFNGDGVGYSAFAVGGDNNNDGVADIYFSKLSNYNNVIPARLENNKVIFNGNGGNIIYFNPTTNTTFTELKISRV